MHFPPAKNSTNQCDIINNISVATKHKWKITSTVCSRHMKAYKTNLNKSDLTIHHSFKIIILLLFNKECVYWAWGRCISTLPSPPLSHHQYHFVQSNYEIVDLFCLFYYKERWCPNSEKGFKYRHSFEWTYCRMVSYGLTMLCLFADLQNSCLCPKIHQIHKKSFCSTTLTRWEII